MQPGFTMKLMKDGRLCCQSSYMFVKYLSRGHTTMSFKVSFFVYYAPALTVEFSSKGASIVNFGVVN